MFATLPRKHYWTDLMKFGKQIADRPRPRFVDDLILMEENVT